MMCRISIDVSPEEHRKLKAVAALKGKIDLGADDQEKALVELEALLDLRIGHHGESRLKGGLSAGAIWRDILSA